MLSSSVLSRAIPVASGLSRGLLTKTTPAGVARQSGVVGSSGRRWETVRVEVPSMGDSISEGTIQTWNKSVGEMVEADEVVAVIDTDKISVDVISPVAGKLTEALAEDGETVLVGNELFVVDTDGVADAGAVAVKAKPAAPAKPLEIGVGEREERRVPMTRMRLRIAERLKSAQSEGVLLTTFQTCDMKPIMDFRKKYQSAIQKKFDGQKLGFMSFFMKATAMALQQYPALNSSIEDGQVLERNYADISVAVATPTGLVVPVIPNVERKGLIELEKTLAQTAKLARDGKLSIEQMTGGTFTISNGGVYGSLAGTPIINPPQSGILGMHSIVETPVVRDGKIVVRPIMQLALTYDHRIVDGREGVSFLKTVADLISNPETLYKELLNELEN